MSCYELQEKEHPSLVSRTRRSDEPLVFVDAAEQLMWSSFLRLQQETAFFTTVTGFLLALLSN